jgi:protein-L-isoaspartate(D-aspartate) O-methyltransferase
MIARAYEDVALPLGYDQTISQPSMIALMLNALQVEPAHRILEVGAGSGYAAALLGELASEVDAIEILPELAQRARQRMAELGIGNVRIFQGNGRLGLPEFGPYDRILVSAGSEDVPEQLLDQLKVGGRIAIPVGDDYGQQLSIGTKDSNREMRWENSVSCIFVPLVGQA